MSGVVGTHYSSLITHNLEQWRRNQYAVLLCVFVSFLGFSFVQPFLPLYVRQLGVTDLAEAAFWSGIVVGVGPLCAAIMGPLWGTLADRYGRKPMVLRALLLISVMMIASAFVPDVRWFLAARVVMGLFAGFTSMVMALAVSVSPRERMAQAIGLVQAAQLAPTAFGPTIGGVISDSFGLRVNFVVTGLMLMVPTVLLFFLVQETGYGGSSDRSAKKPAGARGSALGIFTIPGFTAALAILFMARFADRALPPILPLFLIGLDTPQGQLATITGLVVSSGAVAAAASSMLYGRWARPENSRRLLVIALAGGAVLSVLLALTGSWLQVVALRVVLGLLAGGSMSLAYTMGARLAPAERSGLTLSVLASCAMLGGAVSPMLAGIIGQASLRLVFLANAVAYLAAVGLAALPTLMPRGAPAHEPGPAPEPEA